MEKIVETSALITGYRNGNLWHEVTKPFDGTLYSGELTVLLGSNGSGKSTLLRTLARFGKPLSGEVKLCGKDIHSYSTAELARIAGVVLTDRVDLENMDVFTLVGLGRAPYTGFWGTLTAADRDAVVRALERVGILALKDRQISCLSDGERQKVMIAKAVAQDTPLLLLDEPTAFLDYPSKVEILTMLKETAVRDNKAVLISTHDIDIALRVCDKVWGVDKKGYITTGTPVDMMENGVLHSCFGIENSEFSLSLQRN